MAAGEVGDVGFDDVFYLFFLVRVGDIDELGVFLSGSAF